MWRGRCRVAVAGAPRGGAPPPCAWVDNGGAPGGWPWGAAPGAEPGGGRMAGRADAANKTPTNKIVNSGDNRPGQS